MTELSCGSVQANAKRALYNLEETRASSNGQRTSAKKRKEKPKTANSAHCILFPPIFSPLIPLQFQTILASHVVIKF
jgi:hypothetical protein